MPGNKEPCKPSTSQTQEGLSGDTGRVDQKTEDWHHRRNRETVRGNAHMNLAPQRRDGEESWI